MARFLDETGLKALWEKVKAYVVGQLKGYATTDALAEVRTVADGAQTSVDNMAVAVVDGQLEVTDKEGVTTGYALGGLSEGDANALEALKSRMAMFELVKTADDAPEKAEVTVDGVTYKCNYGQKYAFEVNTGISFRNGRDKWSVEWNDFSRFEPRNMTDMGYMFAYNKKLAKLESGNWDTSKTQSMQSMFENCAALEEVDVKNWNTSACKNMSYAFNGCNALQSLDVSGWDVSKVTNMGNMFNGCNALQSLDVSGWDVSKVTNMGNMFNGCNALQSLDVSGWDTSAVTSMGNMFNGCNALQSLDVSGWDVSKVTNMGNMFYGCNALQSLDVSGWDTSAVTSMGNMFYGCNAKTLILGEGFFKSALTSIEISISNWTDDSVRTSLVTNSYDRTANGLDALTIKLSSRTKAVLTDEDKATMTSKGYVIA